jgi:hypothetical protein
MSTFRRNHYVPEWFQYRFFPPGGGENKFYYLDLRPDTVVSPGGHRYTRNALLRWGPPNCFHQHDLYTTKFGAWESTEIEEKFFGEVDSSARSAVEYWANFQHPSVDSDAFNTLMSYMSIQKLRTPKGLAFLAANSRWSDKNVVLMTLQQLQNIYCAIWTECVWAIADASSAQTKFLLSDHPVTVYNSGCFPASRECTGFNDPDIRLSGTHTLFPLNLDKILILTNLSWVRDPYTNPGKPRPNPNFFRPAMFNFMHVQTGRKLSDVEVNEINFIIKSRAYRYIAAPNREWLYPERHIPSQFWDKLGGGYLLMPDPRSVTFSEEILIGYTDKRADAFDAYGRKPWQRDYRDRSLHEHEWQTFHAFQGEFARMFGPKRRGVCYEMGRLDKEEDSPDFHQYHLKMEAMYKPKNRWKRNR